jgi:hypothetical protein
MASLQEMFRNQETRGGTPGTLSSSGLYVNPNIPRGSRGGIGSRDERAYQGEVQQDELVESRLGNLLSRDNPYIQNARQRGIQGASRRGLLNSSIAAGGAERAAIEAGLPIASADAQTFLQTRMQNQQDLNQNLMQERDIANRMLEAERNSLSAAEAMRLGQQDAEADRRLRLQLQREGLAFQGEQSGLDRQQQEMMGRLGYDMDIGRMGYQFDLTDRNAGRDFQRTIQRDNNSFANEIYGMNEQARLAFGYGDASDTMNWIRDMIGADPSVPPEVYDGLQSFLNDLSGRAYGTLNRFGIGGG